MPYKRYRILELKRNYYELQEVCASNPSWIKIDSITSRNRQEAIDCLNRVMMDHIKENEFRAEFIKEYDENGVEI